MFSIQHFIWVFISLALIAAGLIALKKKKPTLKQVLTTVSIACAASELIKVFSCLELVPSADGSILYPYLELQHLPLHLCSIQILLIFYCRFGRGTIAESRGKQIALQFMYPTCAVGAPFAIALPSIFNTTITVSQAFTHPIAYQTFLFHPMLIVLGIYIPMSGEVKFSWKTYGKTMGLLGFITFVQIYLNSLFANVTYLNGITFVKGFDAASSVTPMTEVFKNAYAERYGDEAPTENCALGFDAYLMALEGIRLSEDTDDGVILTSKLKSIRGLEGATGYISINAQGDPTKDVVIEVITNDGSAVVYTVAPN